MSDPEVVSNQAQGPESFQDYESLREQAVAEFAEIADRLPVIPFVATELDEESNDYDIEVQLDPCVLVSHITHFREAPSQEANLELAYPEHVIEAAAENFGVSLNEIARDIRRREVVDARHMAMYIVREGTELSLLEIGAIFRRDHTTIINAHNRIKEILEKRPYDELVARYEAITSQLQESSHLTVIAAPKGRSEPQRSGESVVAMTREDLFQLPVCTLDTYQSHMLGFDASDPPAALDWGRRNSDQQLWERYGQAALAKTRRLRLGLLEEENADDQPNTRQHLT